MEAERANRSTQREEDPYLRVVRRDEEPEAPDPVAAMLAKFVRRDQLAEIKPPKPLVTGLLFVDTLARMAGKPGDGKSFAALDLACSVVTGQDWHGRVVEQGTAVYLAAEGLSGLSLRLRAWEQHHGLEADDLLIYPEAVQVGSDDWAFFVTCCKRLKPNLIVVDTQARVTAGLDENNATAMGDMVVRLDLLRRTTGAVVLLIHHLTHNGDHARGSTAVLGAMDTELIVSMDKSTRVVTVRVTKQKDAEESAPVTLKLAGVPLGVGEDGEPVGSAVLTSDESGERTPEEDLMSGLEANRIKLLDLLALYSPTLGATKPEFVSWGKPVGISRATVYRAVDDLVRLGMLKEQGSRLFLSEQAARARHVFRKDEDSLT